MKTLRLLPILLLVASSASAQLVQPTSARLADYHAWFDSFDPSSGPVAPDLQTPGSPDVNNADRLWTGWHTNIPPTNLPGPLHGFFPGVYCELVFLGQTGNSWGHFGYQLNGLDHVLSETAANRHFGGYCLPVLAEQDALNFFVESMDASGAWVRQYALAPNPDTPSDSTGLSYFGFLTPLASVRGDWAGLAGENALPFAVLAFTPEAGPASNSSDLFVFALRAGGFRNDAVPEPATYGLVGVAALLALIARRRSCKRRWTQVRSIP